MSRLFWLSDSQWAVIVPCLPSNPPDARRVWPRTLGLKAAEVECLPRRSSLGSWFYRRKAGLDRFCSANWCIERFVRCGDRTNQSGMVTDIAQKAQTSLSPILIARTLGHTIFVCPGRRIQTLRSRGCFAARSLAGNSLIGNYKVSGCAFSAHRPPL